MIRLYVDEVGTDSLKGLDKDNNRYLSLTGTAIELSHARDFLKPKLDELKATLFDDDPDAPIILHRKEILGGKGRFEPIRSNPEFREQFDKAIFDIFTQTDYTVITVLIDKRWMQEQKHWLRTHPYNYLMEILVEKFVQYLDRKGDIGDIMPESRQGKDGILQAEYERVRGCGTDWVCSETIKSKLRASNLKFRSKKANSAGLQLCDLIAHPSHILVRETMGHDVTLGPFASKVADILKSSKYDRSYYGRTKGYGFKHLP